MTSTRFFVSSVVQHFLLSTDSRLKNIKKRTSTVILNLKCKFFFQRHDKRWHSGDKETHKCLVCSKEFATRTSLRNHTSVHTGEKPYQCPYCEKTFRLQCVLKKHKRTHTGEKPYLCSVSIELSLQYNIIKLMGCFLFVCSRYAVNNLPRILLMRNI